MSNSSFEHFGGHLGRYQAGVCAFNGLIYAAGGCSAWNCLNTVECYDPRTDTWTYFKPLVTARRGCGLIVFNGRLLRIICVVTNFM